jgi:hypothetical protein
MFVFVFANTGRGSGTVQKPSRKLGGRVLKLALGQVGHVGKLLVACCFSMSMFNVNVDTGGAEAGRIFQFIMNLAQ